jgi:hypothetical protein
MVYGELGRYPLEIDIKVRMISYWYWHLIDKLCILPFLNTSYMALIPLFTSSFFAILNDPVFENTIPR